MTLAEPPFRRTSSRKRIEPVGCVEPMAAERRHGLEGEHIVQRVFRKSEEPELDPGLPTHHRGVEGRTRIQSDSEPVRVPSRFERVRLTRVGQQEVCLGNGCMVPLVVTLGLFEDP